MDAGDLVADLDEVQAQAVSTPARMVAVIAGAGSGKTRVLTRRVAYRIAEGSAAAEHTMVLTFTREAAGELRRRLPALGIADRITAGTFHSICRGLLQRHWTDRGQRAPTLRHDRDRMVAGLVREVASGRAAAGLDRELAISASRGWGPDEYRAAVQSGVHRSEVGLGVVVDVLTRYRELKAARNIIDLDDLLARTVELFETDADFAAVARWRFRHLLVDEAQDLNPIQHRLLDELRRGNDDLFLVGDPAQAIYGFNGADPSLLVDVATHFPGSEVIRLPTNHRSTPQVVEVGRHVLSRGGQPTDLESNRDHGAKVDIRTVADEDAEVDAIVDEIAALDPAAVRRGEVAVLARTHAVLQPIRARLDALGVPLVFRADASGSPYATLVRSVYRLGTADQLRTWVQDQAETARDSDDAVTQAVVDVVVDFLRQEPAGTGADFERWVDNNNPFSERSRGVELVTFHAAKGREWPTVLIAGAETGLAPHRTATTNAARAEEARLLYVALTRATDRLIVLSAERRGGYQRKPSPFLEGFVPDSPPPVAPPSSLTARPARGATTLDRLQRWRLRTARAAGVLPTQVMSDADLAQIAERAPANAAELDDLLGVGPMMADALFAGISTAVADDSG